MKNLILIFVTFLGLQMSQVYAKIGDTETEVLESHFGARTDRSTINERAHVVVFYTDKTQYAVGILDGKVESEIYTTFEDAKPDQSFVLGVLHGYKEIWYPVGCDNSCAAVMSDDGKMFSRIGASKELNKKYVFWVFTDAWRTFALSLKKPKDSNIVL